MELFPGFLFRGNKARRGEYKKINAKEKKKRGHGIRIPKGRDGQFQRNDFKEKIRRNCRAEQWTKTTPYQEILGPSPNAQFIYAFYYYY